MDGTLNEAQNIKDILETENIACRIITGATANEESFKSLSGHSPQLLHVATHGFYIGNKNDEASIKLTSYLNQKATSNQNAMTETGLLFAGANRTLRGQNKSIDIEDGVLTAYEISNLDLSSTDLVILSACETGLGKNVLSEGVYGLQRAFKLAGVNTIVMSLWEVPDNETSRLMQLFYEYWLGGMEKHEAFSTAQKVIKKEKPNPYYWAGFVMMD